MKRTQVFDESVLPRKRHNATPVQSRSSSPAPCEVARSTLHHKRFNDSAHVSTPDARPSLEDSTIEDNGPAGSEISALPPGNHMFPHASHFQISESVFANGPVSVTYAAERNTEEILKVSL